jgi:hypothetical protein
MGHPASLLNVNDARVICMFMYIHARNYKVFHVKHFVRTRATFEDNTRVKGSGRGRPLYTT